MIDKDGGGSLSKAEIVEAVKSDQEVIKFLTTCGERTCSFYCAAAAEALEILDTDKSAGEVDESEWDEAIRARPLEALGQLAAEQERRAKRRPRPTRSSASSS